MASKFLGNSISTIHATYAILHALPLSTTTSMEDTSHAVEVLYEERINAQDINYEKDIDSGCGGLHAETCHPAKQVQCQLTMNRLPCGPIMKYQY